MEIQKQVPPLAEIKVSKAKEAPKPAISEVNKSSIGDTFAKSQDIATAGRNLKLDNQVSLKSSTTASSSSQQNQPVKSQNILAELSRTKEDLTDIGPDEGA